MISVHTNKLLHVTCAYIANYNVPGLPWEPLGGAFYYTVYMLIRYIQEDDTMMMITVFWCSMVFW